MPLASSVGWFGCKRTDSRPGKPIVLLNFVTTEILRATAMRSWLRISLHTAAAISGVRPGASAANVSAVVSCVSRKSRKAPTVRPRTGANAAASCVSWISRVTSSVS